MLSAAAHPRMLRGRGRASAERGIDSMLPAGGPARASGTGAWHGAPWAPPPTPEPGGPCWRQPAAAGPPAKQRRNKAQLQLLKSWQDVRACPDRVLRRAPPATACSRVPRESGTKALQTTWLARATRIAQRPRLTRLRSTPSCSKMRQYWLRTTWAGRQARGRRGGSGQKTQVRRNGAPPGSVQQHGHAPLSHAQLAAAQARPAQPPPRRQRVCS